ncbi:MAG: glycosyltransferase family 4 protein [Thermoplasmata archaeon]|nr:glycosyltransferase family 4 protein [Thermoplasmata archaeon]
MIKKIKICFVSPSSYPLLKNIDLGYVGGAEVQQVVLAKELQRRNYQIFFITYSDDDYCDMHEIDGIKLVPIYNMDNVKNLNYVQKALYIWRKMKDVDADIYIHRSGAPGIASLFGILHHKKVIYFLASDSDFTGENVIKRNKIGQLLRKFGNWLDIKFSDIIISQNNFQQNILQIRYGVKSIIIKNAFDIPLPIKVNKGQGYILWIGTIRSIKQPELYLDIAKHFPEYKFVMIGGAGDDPELFNKIRTSAQQIGNLDFKGFIPRNRIFEYYKKAALFVSTSKTEGFPNVFLEAWLNFIPVVSLNVDPDDIILKYKLGYCSRSYDQMIKDIRILMQNEELRQSIGKNGREYVEKFHDIKKIVDEYQVIFRIV